MFDHWKGWGQIKDDTALTSFAAHCPGPWTKQAKLKQGFEFNANKAKLTRVRVFLCFYIKISSRGQLLLAKLWDGPDRKTAVRRCAAARTLCAACSCKHLRLGRPRKCPVGFALLFMSWAVIDLISKRWKGCQRPWISWTPKLYIYIIYIYCKSYNDDIWWHHDLSMPVQPKPMPSGILSLNFVRAVDCRLMWRWTKLSFALCGWYHHSWSRDIQAPSVCFGHGETLQFSASPQSFISFKPLHRLYISTLEWLRCRNHLRSQTRLCECYASCSLLTRAARSLGGPPLQRWGPLVLDCKRLPRSLWTMQLLGPRQKKGVFLNIFELFSPQNHCHHRSDMD